MKTPDTTIPAAAGPNKVEIYVGNRVATVAAYDHDVLPILTSPNMFTKNQLWESVQKVTIENLELRKCAQALLDVYNAEDLNPYYHDEAEIAEKILSSTKGQRQNDDKKTKIHFLDNGNRATDYLETQRTDGGYTEWADESTIFDHICKKEKLDLSKKFLVEIFCKGGKKYFFYNEGLGK